MANSLPLYKGPESKLQQATPRLPVPHVSLGRPSQNLGNVFNSSHMRPPVNLFAHILPSNPLPFSQVRNPATPIVPHMKVSTSMRTQVPLSGTNLTLPLSLPAGLVNHPNFQKSAERIKNALAAVIKSRSR